MNLTMQKKKYYKYHVIIRSGSISSGWSVMEHIAGVDYCRISQFLDFTKQQASTSILLTKPEFTQLLGVAQTERERQCISYLNRLGFLTKVQDATLD